MARSHATTPAAMAALAAKTEQPPVAPAIEKTPKPVRKTKSRNKKR